MHRVKRSKKKPVLLIVLGIFIVLVLCVVFFVPLNNAVRTATGNDTPTDSLIKDQLADKVKSTKTGDPEQDKRVDQYADKLKGTKMSTIMKAANNEQQAAQLIHDTSSLSMTASEKVAHELFTNDQYNGLRSSMSSGNWIGTYQQYKKLSNNGSLMQLKQSVNQ